MTRRLLLISATYVSLLLAVASGGMWARSQWVDEAWESQPRCDWSPPQTWPRDGARSRWGWSRYSVVGSSAGRFILARNEGQSFEVLTPSPLLPAAATRFTPGRGYMHPAPALIFDRSSYALRTRSGAAGWLPGIEWASMPRDRSMQDGGHWFLSVS
jgi:hypothetical protein